MYTTSNRVLWLLVTLGSVLVLGGCGSSPPVRYYTLDPIPASASVSPPANTMGVGPLRFPDYLKRPQIVSSGDGGQVEVAEFDRWAGAAEATFQRTLTQNLTTLLEDTMAIEFPFGGGLVEPDYRLVGQINDFATDANGTATLDVNWVVVDMEGNPAIAARRSLFTAQATSPGSYAARVEAMNETLRSFSREVADLYQQSAP